MQHPEGKSPRGVFDRSETRNAPHVILRRLRRRRIPSARGWMVRGARVNRPCAGARSFAVRSHDSASRCAGRRGRRPLQWDRGFMRSTLSQVKHDAVYTTPHQSLTRQLPLKGKPRNARIQAFPSRGRWRGPSPARAVTDEVESKRDKIVGATLAVARRENETHEGRRGKFAAVYELAPPVLESKSCFCWEGPPLQRNGDLIRSSVCTGAPSP